LFSVIKNFTGNLFPHLLLLALLLDLCYTVGVEENVRDSQSLTKKVYMFLCLSLAIINCVTEGAVSTFKDYTSFYNGQQKKELLQIVLPLNGYEFT